MVYYQVIFFILILTIFIEKGRSLYLKSDLPLDSLIAINFFDDSDFNQINGQGYHVQSISFSNDFYVSLITNGSADVFSSIALISEGDKDVTNSAQNGFSSSSLPVICSIRDKMDVRSNMFVLSDISISATSDGKKWRLNYAMTVSRHEFIQHVGNSIPSYSLLINKKAFIQEGNEFLWDINSTSDSQLIDCFSRGDSVWIIFGAANNFFVTSVDFSPRDITESVSYTVSHDSYAQYPKSLLNFEQGLPIMYWIVNEDTGIMMHRRDVINEFTTIQSFGFPSNTTIALSEIFPVPETLCFDDVDECGVVSWVISNDSDSKIIRFRSSLEFIWKKETSGSYLNLRSLNLILHEDGCILALLKDERNIDTPKVFSILEARLKSLTEGTFEDLDHLLLETSNSNAKSFGAGIAFDSEASAELVFTYLTDSGTFRKATIGGFTCNDFFSEIKNWTTDIVTPNASGDFRVAGLSLFDSGIITLEFISSYTFEGIDFLSMNSSDGSKVTTLLDEMMVFEFDQSKPYLLCRSLAFSSMNASVFQVFYFTNTSQMNETSYEMTTSFQMIKWDIDEYGEMRNTSLYDFEYTTVTSTPGILLRYTCSALNSIVRIPFAIERDAVSTEIEIIEYDTETSFINVAQTGVQDTEKSASISWVKESSKYFMYIFKGVCRENADPNSFFSGKMSVHKYDFLSHVPTFGETFIQQYFPEGSNYGCQVKFTGSELCNLSEEYCGFALVLYDKYHANYSVQFYNSSGILQNQASQSLDGLVSGEMYRFDISVSQAGCVYISCMIQSSSLMKSFVFISQKDITGNYYSNFSSSLNYWDSNSQSSMPQMNIFAHTKDAKEYVFMISRDDIANPLQISLLKGITCSANLSKPSNDGDLDENPDEENEKDEDDLEEEDFQDLSSDVTETQILTTTVSSIAFSSGTSILVVNTMTSLTSASSATASGTSGGSAAASSGGTAGMMTQFINHCQFAVLMGCLGAEYPDSLNNYYEGFAWIMGLVKIDSVEKTLHSLRKTDSSGRKLLAEGNKSGIDRFANAFGIRRENLFFNAFAIFLIVLSLILSIYLIARIASFAKETVFRKPISPLILDKLKSISIGLSIRVFLVFYTSLCLFSTYQLTLEDHWMIEILAVLCLLTCIIVGAFGTLIVASLNEEKYKSEQMKLRFGAYYTDYTLENRYFFLILLGHKMFTAAFIATLEDQSVIQICVLLAIHFIYCWSLYKISPYCDHFQQNVALVVSFAQSIQMLVTIGFSVGITGTTADFLAYALIVLHMLIVMAYSMFFLRKAALLIYNAAKKKLAKNDEHVSSKPTEMTCGDSANVVSEKPEELIDIPKGHEVIDIRQNELSHDKTETETETGFL